MGLHRRGILMTLEPPISRCTVCDAWCIGKVCLTCKINYIYFFVRP